MSFVEPLFLAGLLAAALPIVVHLINRRKAVPQDFPAMRFLLESSRKESSGIKVRQWALMALRILVIAFLAFSLAKPYILSSTGVSASDRLPTATVFVVDSSYSMGNDDWWRNASAEIEDYLDRLRPWDEVALATTAPGAPAPVSRLTSTHSELTDALEDFEPKEHVTHLPEAMLAASEILAASQLPNRRIVVISDFARGGFPLQTTPERPIPHEVELVSVRDGDETPENLAITAIDYRQEGSSREATWRIDVTIRNFGEERHKVELRLLIDDTMASGGLVEVEPGKTASHTFRHKIEGSGVKHAVVELDGPDELAGDDRRHAAIQLEGKINTLVVNGEPSSVVYRDETFFLERALNPHADSESNIVPELTTREGLAGKELQNFDVVVLANVSRVTPLTAKKLETFVRDGGGLFVAMGDQVDVTAYNQHLGDLLPKPLRGLKQLAEIDDPDAPLKITRIGTSRRQHPIFQVFELPGGASLQSVEVFSYMLLEPSPPEQSTTLLSFKDSAPALLERRVGDGRVLLFTTTVDDEWTSAPYRTAYLPLIRRSMQYLARRATSEGKTRHLVGDRVTLEVGSLVRERVIIRTPSERRVVLEPVDGKVTYEPTESGFYRVFADSDEGKDAEDHRIDGLAFTVNVDTGESNLEMLPDKALDPWIEGRSEEAAKTGGELSGPQKRVNLWPTFLFLITLFLLAETVLGTRRSVLSRLWRRLTGQPEPDLDDLQ